MPIPGGHLAADELVELDLIGGGDNFTVSVVNFELRGRDFGVVLLVLEAHGALNFRRGVDEGAQRVAGQRVVVAAGVYVLEPARFGKAPFGVESGEEEAFDLVGGVQGVALLLVQAVREALQHTAHIGGIAGAVLVDDFAEDEHLAGPKKSAGA